MMKKMYLLFLAVSLSISAFAQEKFELGKPNDDNYRYLDEYQALKDYIDHSKYPNFKLGVGAIESDYLNKSLVKKLINTNFTETVPGNAMKMGSVVDANGNMNFTTVKNFVNTATRAGLNVYGHTLAWHSQQPKAWLLKLLTSKSAKTPLTQQECHDTLVYAMDKWIKGMMKACNGKVKAWDLVNEPLAGEGNDGEGNYTLQHAEGYDPDDTSTWDVGGENFFWQDYMGDLEYVRQACRLARKYGPEDMVLFINDYNLEGSWDLVNKDGVMASKKLVSLINWIKKWEADGVTKIDGIGTQMHLYYFEDSGIQANLKKAITGMFKLMAKTGKLVRVSELDMGYSLNGHYESIPTSQLTEAQHKKMANFYEWIIKEYLRIIPPEQQWGICPWNVTDSPANSGWRPNSPVGIWDTNYYRKHVYAGFVRGLGGVVDGIMPITPHFSEGVWYDMKGQELINKPMTTGVYIINGKKVVIR